MAMEFLAFHNQRVTDLAAHDEQHDLMSFHIISTRRSPARSSNSASEFGRNRLMARVSVVGFGMSRETTDASTIRCSRTDKNCNCDSASEVMVIVNAIVR